MEGTVTISLQDYNLLQAEIVKKQEHMQKWDDYLDNLNTVEGAAVLFGYLKQNPEALLGTTLFEHFKAHGN